MANDIHCVWVYLIYPQGAPWFSFSSSSWGRWLLLALWNNSFVIFLLRCVLGDGLIAKLCQTLATPLTVAFQAPLSMGFSREEYWSGLPFPSPEVFPTQESNLGLLHCRQILHQQSYKGSPKLRRSLRRLGEAITIKWITTLLVPCTRYSLFQRWRKDLAIFITKSDFLLSFLHL